MTGDLPIPDASLTALVELADEWGAEDDIAVLHADVVRVAAPVVAAYLRRLTTLRPFADVQDELRRHANALDGEPDA